MCPIRMTATTTLLTPVVAAAIIAGGALTTPASAEHERLPDGRHIKPYTVRSGDTATELAVTFHAWTAELIAHNHLGSGAALTVGEQIEIPVVTAAVDKPRSNEKARSHRRTQARSAKTVAHPSRHRVRQAIVRVSRRQGVDPQLSLAVSWQEAGWRMHHVSSAGAVGAMQVLPSTAKWMELYVGRDLKPRRLRDNVATGVTLLGVLAAETVSRARQVGAYYQGLGAVHRHGLYDDTRAYVDNVLAIKHRLEGGRPPA
ncbi:MAG: lytic transglycosylase domain-containing protein [Nocardioides sp.]